VDSLPILDFWVWILLYIACGMVASAISAYCEADDTAVVAVGIVWPVMIVVFAVIGFGLIFLLPKKCVDAWQRHREIGYRIKDDYRRRLSSAEEWNDRFHKQIADLEQSLKETRGWLSDVEKKGKSTSMHVSTLDARIRHKRRPRD
jgi:hypothetical protein